MNRKTREIALLSMPVIALALVVPGARWLADWREAHQVPRIESFELRAPTAWEVSQGATVGYTARTVVPNDGGPFWSGGIEIRNANGEHWASDTPLWNQVAVASDADEIGEGGNADSPPEKMILRGGLKWNRIAGKNTSAQVEISLWPNNAAPKKHIEAARIFTLQNRVSLSSMTSLHRTSAKFASKKTAR